MLQLVTASFCVKYVCLGDLSKRHFDYGVLAELWLLVWSRRHRVARTRGTYGQEEVCWFVKPSFFV